MTELIGREHSRRTFLKGGGALIVGFTLARGGLGATAAQADLITYPATPPSSLDGWISIHEDNTVRGD